MKKTIITLLLLSVGLESGCALQEVRSKTTAGPEWRHKGSDSTNDVRWSVQQGFEFKWDKGIGTGIAYRRRDVDDGAGDNDNGVWLDFSFPIWKAKKTEVKAEQIRELNERIAQLEAKLAERVAAESGKTNVQPESGSGTN